jgi:hypothetical protein
MVGMYKKQVFFEEEYKAGLTPTTPVTSCSTAISPHQNVDRTQIAY